ncbi:speckle-type POZ [Fusarium mundagurra]|uniref:Speckle-type POZ n=1 Tax=Fusarium mundagurra TaxID=1567541 RepID=A0A8H5YDP5_9HYPO|nr:speckle-type POZ [Fusarium mundagurra]
MFMSIASVKFKLSTATWKAGRQPFIFANSSPFYNQHRTEPQTPFPYIQVHESLPKMASDDKKQHFEMLGKSLFKLYETEMYSDLIITCGWDVHKVHKAIICPRSSFFTAACSGNFKEGLESRINLPDDDPTVVREMLYYLYNLDLVGYEFIPEDGNFIEEELSDTEYENAMIRRLAGHRFVGNRRVKGLVPKLGARIGPPANLTLFAKVYALGEKYGIPGLKTIALSKFETLAKAYAQTEDFRLAVHEVYTSTIDQDRGLRDVVVSTVEENLVLLNNQNFEDLTKTTALGHDLLMKVTSTRRAG